MPHPAFIVFQFLIGTLKTEKILAPERRVLGFQFLIGTLKTLEKTCSVLDEKMFQFLIGTLKTNRCKRKTNTAVLVSIPHRYAKNRLVRWACRPVSRVSIPHRYAKNAPATQDLSF